MPNNSQKTIRLTCAGNEGIAVFEQLKTRILKELPDIKLVPSTQGEPTHDRILERYAVNAEVLRIVLEVPPGIYYAVKIVGAVNLLHLAKILKRVVGNTPSSKLSVGTQQFDIQKASSEQIASALTTDP